MYLRFLKLAVSKDTRFIWIDETSFNQNHLKLRSWVHAKGEEKVIKPYNSDSIACMAALTDEGQFLCKLRKGTNKEVQFIDFFLDLVQWLRKHLKQKYTQYRRKLVVCMDNASIHLTKEVEEAFKCLGVVALTLPPYTPEYNPIENVFALFKHKVNSW